MDRLAKARANCSAAAAAGSAMTAPERSRPSLVHSGEIGETTSSGTYDGSQAGLTAGPVNTEASYRRRTAVRPRSVSSCAVASAKVCRSARGG